MGTVVPGGDGTGGGDGAPGWIRLDVATFESESVPDLDYEADLFSRDHIWQGPRLAASTPRVIAGSTASFVVSGDPAETYALQLDDDAAVAVGGNQPKELALERGLHVLCTLIQGDNLQLPEAQHCLTIAVLDQ